MSYNYILILFITMFGISACESRVHREAAEDTSRLISKDTVQIASKDSLVKRYNSSYPRDSAGMISVLVEHSVIIFKEADTTSGILKELSFDDYCLVPIQDILEMKLMVRCIHDSIVGYVRKAELFRTVSSALPEKKYIVWLTPRDSVKVIRINTNTHLIEEQLTIEKQGVYIRARLLDTDLWPEAFSVIEIEMNPAACEATSFVHVIDYKGKLKYLIETSSYGDEGGSYSSELLFKKGLFLDVITTEAWQDDENGPTHYKSETAKFKWNGDSLVSIKK